MTLFDHAFALLIGIVFPIVGFISFRRLLRRVAAGEKVSRRHIYRSTMASHWTLFFLCIVLWAWADRDWPTLGLGLELNLGFALAAVLTVAGIVVLIGQNRHVAGMSREAIEDTRQRFGDVSLLMPENGNELASFSALSVTAGIVEEVLWRGFLIWYLAHFMPLWAAALLNIVAFGVAHAYQGLSNLLPITLVGAAFTLLFFLSGSLWLPIILHMAVDIGQGRFGYLVNRRATFDEDAAVADSSPG